MNKIESMDSDPEETQEWLDALSSVLKTQGAERVQYLLQKLSVKLTEQGSQLPYAITTPYRNTIPVHKEARMPGDLFVERNIRSLIRWNAMAMVMRANIKDATLGGHISTFQSSATLYDVGFNYFFRANQPGLPGDLLYIQGHSAPGIYARSFLEGDLSEDQLDRFRQEVDGDGLSSYPHPWLMPEYWQFPTVSMGLGPLQAIYQAHIMKYLVNRGLAPESDRKVWCFIGDGEMDEPESLGAISLAGREGLDNLIFVVNCNLQRLDGPVRGNGKIIQELEGAFRGAGWNVIKVVWGRQWDALFEKDTQGLLQQRMDDAVDGDYQNYKSHDGGYVREHFFGAHPELSEMVSDLTDEQISRLNRGGHDPYKVYAAYAAAVAHKGQPTVILAKTVKGYGLGLAGEAQNFTHSVKKLDTKALREFRDRFDIPINDEDLEAIPYYRPPEDSMELRYLKTCREKLGGAIPSRLNHFEALTIPDLEAFASVTQGSGDREISTTMAFVRLLSILVKDPHIGERIVPIVPDEARTFGMEGCSGSWVFIRAWVSSTSPSIRVRSCLTVKTNMVRLWKRGSMKAAHLLLGSRLQPLTPIMRKRWCRFISIILCLGFSGSGICVGRQAISVPADFCWAAPRVEQRSMGRACSIKTGIAISFLARCPIACPMILLMRTSLP